MRARKKKHLDERLSACGDIIYSDSFPFGKGYEVEIGCGKGDFICKTALSNPNKRFIAIEKISDVMVMACEKALKMGIKNVTFISADAKDLSEMFEKGSVERIYVNFCDPWPKKKQAKRRLVHRNFLSLYKDILTQNGEIWFKTDNRPLFEFALEEFKECGFVLSQITFDLHNDNFKENVMTEYERRFSSEGVPICRLVAKISL